MKDFTKTAPVRLVAHLIRGSRPRWIAREDDGRYAVYSANGPELERAKAASLPGALEVRVQTRREPPYYSERTVRVLVEEKFLAVVLHDDRGYPTFLTLNPSGE